MKSKKLNRDDLIRLVDRIMNSSGCIVDVDGLLNQFEANVTMRNAGELIFNPPEGRKLSAVEIVDRALSQ